MNPEGNDAKYPQDSVGSPFAETSEAAVSGLTAPCVTRRSGGILACLSFQLCFSSLMFFGVLLDQACPAQVRLKL